MEQGELILGFYISLANSSRQLAKQVELLTFVCVYYCSHTVRSGTSFISMLAYNETWQGYNLLQTITSAYQFKVAVYEEET